MTEAGAARRPWVPANVDPSKPSVARVYDFYLGGSHNFEADREFGRQVIQGVPSIPRLAQENRAFMRRAVLYMLEQGIDQFLDLGSGIPTAGNVHEIAQKVNPRARVVYVDHDPVAVAHGTALLEANPLATSLHHDVRHPDEVLTAATDSGVLDLDRPVGVLAMAVLHCITDDDHPRDLVSHYMTSCAPGSYLAMSHARSDGQTHFSSNVSNAYDKNSASPSRTVQLRTKAEIEALFVGVTLLDPGVVPAPIWRPEIGTAEPVDPAEVPDDHPVLAGVGRKD